MKKMTVLAAIAIALCAALFVLSPDAEVGATSCALKMESGIYCDTQCTYNGADWYCFDEGPTCCTEDSSGCKNLNSSECDVCSGPGCTLADF